MSICVDLKWLAILIRWWPEVNPYTDRMLKPAINLRIGGRLYSTTRLTAILWA